MAQCTDPAREIMLSGDWVEAIVCWLTAGGDPNLMMVMPMVIYGAILIGLFIVGSSPLIPVVVSIILSGVIFTTFPAGPSRIALIVIILIPAIAGMLFTWRMGR